MEYTWTNSFVVPLTPKTPTPPGTIMGIDEYLSSVNQMPVTVTQGIPTMDAKGKTNGAGRLGVSGALAAIVAGGSVVGFLY